MKAIAISGMEAACALADNLTNAVRLIKNGTYSLRPIETVSVHQERKFIAGKIPCETDPFSLTLEVVKKAFEHANLSAADLKNAGVFIGTTAGVIFGEEEEINRAFQTHGSHEVSMNTRGLGVLGQRVAEHFKIRGPVFTYSTACTSSAVAMIAAANAIKCGRLERAIVMGVDFLTNLTLYGFRSLLLYDPNRIRPFDVRRNGLQLGEAVACLILEKSDDRSKTHPKIWGTANISDNRHITATAEDGASVAEVMQMALKNSPKDQTFLRAIKAHGTATRDNDLAEGRGINKLFGTSIPFSSIKGYMGHTLGAAGALEIALYLSCLEQGFIPLSLGFEREDPDIGLNPMTQHLEAIPGYYMMNFFGFGGSATSLVVEHV